MQILNDDYGLNLTCGTLAALIKYPSFSESKDRGGYEKFGVFESEKHIMKEVWTETGLEHGVRHPFAHIMEACDDIAYAVLDAEDVVKKGFASFSDIIDHLKPLETSGDKVTKWVVEKALKKNKVFKKENLSSRELNEISMQVFRIFAISKLIEAVINSFVDNIDKIMDKETAGGFHLLEVSCANDFCKTLQEFDKKHGFMNKKVLQLELMGHNHIVKTMNMLWVAIASDEKTPFKKYAQSVISDNYQRVHSKSSMNKDYKNCQLLCDSISGMTDSHLIRVYEDLVPLFNHDKIKS